MLHTTDVFGPEYAMMVQDTGIRVDNGLLSKRSCISGVDKACDMSRLQSILIKFHGSTVQVSMPLS